MVSNSNNSTRSIHFGLIAFFFFFWLETSANGFQIEVPLIPNAADLIENALREGIETDRPIYFPPGVYVVDRLISIKLEQKTNLRIFGEQGQTVFKRAGGTIKGRWDGLLQIQDPEFKSNLLVDGITVTTSGKENPLPDGADRYAWEQAAGFAALGQWNEMILSRCAAYDCVADGFWLGGKTIGRVSVSEFRGWDRNRTRSCLTLTFNGWDQINLFDLDVIRIDCEPNGGIEANNQMFIENLRCDDLDVMAKSAATLFVNQLTVTRSMSVAGFDSTFENFHATLDRHFRPVSGQHRFINGTFQVGNPFKGDTRWVNSLIYNSGGHYSPKRVTFEKVNFQKGPNTNPTYVYMQDQPVPEFIEFIDCKSDFPLVDPNRPGDVRVSNE